MKLSFEKPAVDSKYPRLVTQRLYIIWLNVNEINFIQGALKSSDNRD
jgi:hypothetical protein